MRKADTFRPYPPDFCDAQTLAYRLSCSERTVTDYCRAGLLPKPIMIGNLVRWSWAEVEAHIALQNGLPDPAAADKDDGDEYEAAIKALPISTKKARHDTVA
jgi:predicted DNA-binding transcriptional regulator AlpA